MRSKSQRRSQRLHLLIHQFSISQSRRDLPARSDRLRFIEADVSDALAALGKGEYFDEIYHLAAAVGVKLVVEDPILAIETNIGRTIDLLRFALTRSATGGPAPTLVVCSSFHSRAVNP